jgi:uncharacterized protein (DUF433 family)
MNEKELFSRITCDPDIFGGKPILRGHRLAVQHVLDMLAGGDDEATILSGYPWMEPEDIKASLAYASRNELMPVEAEGRREDFERYLAAVPNAAPVETDRLPEDEPKSNREITRKEHEI